VDPEVAVIHEVIEDLRGQLVKVVEQLDDADINRTFPGLQNTIGILLRHTAASENFWISGVAGGGSRERNRDAEFGREPLAKQGLVRTLREAQAATDRVLTGLRAAELQAPVQVERARGTLQTTKAFALLHALQHLAYHLGQIRLMAAMARHAREKASA